MDINEQIQQYDDLLKFIHLHHSLIEEYLKQFIIKQGEIYQQREYEIIKNSPPQFLGFDLLKPTLHTNIDNLTLLNAKSYSFNKEEFMQNISKIKNARVRKDGRYEWRKMINGNTYQVIERDITIFKKEINAIKKRIKQNIISGFNKPKESLILFDRIKLYHERNIKPQVLTGMLKPQSARRYDDLLTTLSVLKRDIRDYKKDDIIDFFNSLTHHRTGAYCFYLLKRVFADEVEKGTIKINPITTLKNPFPAKRCVKKGSWLDLQQQQILKQNLGNDITSKEIMFYLMTGCRLKEAESATIDFDKQIAIIKRTKTENYGVKQTTIPLSKKFCDYIKDDWPKMFKMLKNSRSHNITTFMKRIGIKDKSTHSLRHTFSSNLYYLGVDPKKHQYLMGHSSITQTYDTYTTLDISITKQDIIDIWGDFYPIY